MITITDNKEPLVDLIKYCPIIINKLDDDTKRDVGKVYVRKTIAQEVCRAAKKLPPVFRLGVHEACRTQKTQKRLYFHRLRKFKKNFPQWSKKKLLAETARFVAPYEGKIVSGHMTGGAIDLCLCNPKGRKLPTSLRKNVDYRKQTRIDSPVPKHMKYKRDLIHQIMHSTKLTNYPREWWHFSYGDWMWAKRTGKKLAFYDKIDLKKIKC